MAASLSERPQLQYLTAQLDELRQKGTHFRLRVLDDIQAPVCPYDGKPGHQSRLQQLSRPLQSPQTA